MKREDFPAWWNDEDVAKYQHFQEYALSDDEVAVLEVEIAKLTQSLELAFGNRTDFALTAFVGNWLSHKLMDEDEAFNVHYTINDWICGAIKKCEPWPRGPWPYKLVRGEPD